jgi:hypothetical protein
MSVKAIRQERRALDFGMAKIRQLTNDMRIIALRFRRCNGKAKEILRCQQIDKSSATANTNARLRQSNR